MIIRNEIFKGKPQGSDNKKQNQAKPRSRTRLKIKPSVVAVYLGTFVLIVAIVFIGYRQPQNTTTTSSNPVLNNAAQIEQTSVDAVIATGVAANVAQVADLPIATSIANLAVSTQSQSSFTKAEGVSDVKPQLIGLGSENRTVISYTVRPGDTVDTVASAYGLSKNTIKWANNLTSDSLVVGSVIKILPVDGVVYKVKSGDTIDSIASRYGTDKTRLILYNDLDVSGLRPNTTIILPNATLPGNERPGYVAPAAQTYYYAGAGAGFGGRTWRIQVGGAINPYYAFGNCTAWAYVRRQQLGLPVGSNWGNASSWAYNARMNGLTVNSSPSVGAIIQNGGYLGHVGIVETILPNGDLSISEMNAYVAGGGFNIVSGRIVPAGNVGQYLYIH